MSTVPIVYLPGAGGRSSFWRPVADRLWRHGAPIVLGYPGFGDVPPDPSLGSLDDLYRAIRSILPQRFHLVAQSMGNVLALDSKDGKTLWHAGAGAAMDSSPITYELDGRQYVMTSSGGVLFAWALPEVRAQH